MKTINARVAIAVLVAPLLSLMTTSVFSGECGCNGRQSQPTCQSAPSHCSHCTTCRHSCRRCFHDNAPPQGAVVASMPAMFVAPIAFAQPANFVMTQNQPTLNIPLQSPQPQQSISVEDLKRALQNALPQQAPQSSCSKSGNGLSQALSAPVPPADNELENRVSALETRIAGLESKLDKELGEANQTLKRILSKLPN